MLKALGYLSVLSVSFYVSLFIIDRNNDRHSPLLGTDVVFELSAEKQPEVCAVNKSKIVFKGTICEVDGQDISIDWKSLANVTNSQPACGPPIVSWSRKNDDPAYNARYLGECGAAPRYFQAMPAVFHADVLRAARS